MKWWRDFDPVAICYHPYADRFQPCAQIQECGKCAARRFVSDIGKAWHPSVREGKHDRR